MARRLLRLVVASSLLSMSFVLGPALAQAPIVAWSYTVRTGDTMSGIARAMGVSIEALAAANGLSPPYVLRSGQVLRRPDPAGAPPPPRPVSLLPPRPAASASRPPNLLWPTSGAIVSRYGAPVKGLANNGFDLAALPGMGVYSAAAGRVLFAGTEPERFGQLILIDHGGGWVTAYAYLGKVRVKEGDSVARRQLIARIGKSGEAKKPTLHFELRQNNRPRDPYPYLPIRL
ncbi:M23 family metallopeptidase [Novosphingobium sp. Chol11]|uniref:M23 family metallopeptidase n=1 Tax=Novosphingobium sp. Chol11 TaxID=1385763 RepID=UPI0025EBCC54|nr:M23 family metallopeptidase [Novosphingobium sp. Chol11]